MNKYNILFFILLLAIIYSINGIGNTINSPSCALKTPNDSLLNKVTNLDKKIKAFTVKDTIGGYSTPRKIETVSYFRREVEEKEMERDKEGRIIVPFNYQPFLSYVTFRDTVILNPTMLPVVFDGELLMVKDLNFKKTPFINRTLPKSELVNKDSIIGSSLYLTRQLTNNNYILIARDNTLASNLEYIKRVKATRKQYYIIHPEKIKSNALTFDGSPIISTEVEQRNPFKTLISASDAINIIKPNVKKHKTKQVFWRYGADHRFHFSFEEYSKNWSPKTNRNFTLESYQKFWAKYRKNKISFDLELEWRLNVQYMHVPRDDRDPNVKYNYTLIKDDWVRSYNKIGFDAFVKNWKYIFNIEVKSPMFDKYPQKTEKIQSAFLSPFSMNVGVGVGYELGKKYSEVRGREFKLVVDATPLSMSYEKVKRKKVLEFNNPGFEEGKTSKTEWGSTFNLKFEYKFNNYTSVNSRAKYFTNYTKTTLEWESTFEFRLNKFLSTKVYLYTKFNDSVEEKFKDEKFGYFSYKTDLSFGLSYSW